MQGQVISDQFIIGDDGLYYRYNKTLTNVKAGDIVSFEQSDNIAINVTFVSKKPPKEEPKESVLEKIKNIDVEKIKNKDFKKFNFKNLFKFARKKDENKTIFEEYESNLENNVKDDVDNMAIKKDSLNSKTNNKNSDKNSKKFVFAFDTHKDEKTPKKTEFSDYEKSSNKLEKSSKSSFLDRLKNTKKEKKEKDFIINDRFKKEKNKNPKEISVAKITAILSYLIPTLLIAIIFYNNPYIAETSYENMSPSIAILLVISFLIIPIGTFVALKIISNLSGARVHISYLKAIFYPIILIFLFMFAMGFLNRFLLNINSKEVLIITNLILFIILIFIVIYCVKLQLRVFFELAKLTKVEFFKLYGILIVVSIILSLLPYIFGLFMVLLVIFGNFFVNILPILSLLGFASYFVGIAAFLVYLVSWIKVKEVRNAMFV